MAMNETNETPQSAGRLRSVFLEISERAMHGEMTIDEFWKLVPRTGLDPFLEKVAEDLADAIEHTPGKWFGGGIDWDVWYTSEGYLTIYLDTELLKKAASPLILLDARKRVLAEPMLSQASIDLALARIQYSG